MLIAIVVGVRLWFDRPGAADASSVDAEVLAQGRALYDATCATCHGVDGQGFAQADVPAPPLDGSAHSWHHSDTQIVGLLRGGGSIMPAVGADWSDEEITAVLSYVKSRWEPWQRESQPGTIGE